MNKTVSTPSSDFKKGISVLSCSGVGKTFPIFDELTAWRILFQKNITFPTITALSDISLSVPKGKFVGILGRNGAGKSTLLRTLGGVYSPTSGKIDVNGDLTGLFELGGFGSRFMTGREYAKRLLRLQGVKVEQMDGIIAEIKNFSELKESFEKNINTYSSGMAARLYFSTATALQHDVYLVDEILSVGDEHFQSKCWHRLRDRFSQGASGILVTHDWSAIIKLCEEAHILDNGRITESGRPDKIVQSYLDLPLPTRNKVRFLETNPMQYIVKSANDTRIVFDIELNEEMLVNFGYSIELLRIGLGWEILLLQDPEPLVNMTKPGIYQVELFIPKLPLAEGRYFLNLFLNSPSDSKSGASIAYDAKTWTSGNAIELWVEGNSLNSSLALPLTWEVEN